jgi:hypothetical protein
MIRRASAATLASYLVLMSAATPWPARAAAFKPPVTDEPKAGAAVWFARVEPGGRWCGFASRKTLDRRAKRDQIMAGDFGWARYGGDRLQSVTYAQESEDAYVEDRYVVGANNEVTKMVRTGHYFRDPWVSLTFAPDGRGRLRLTPASRRVLHKMEMAGHETYFSG